MKRILVPTDFSHASLSAYEYALRIAEHVKAEVVLLHLIELPLIRETMAAVQPSTYVMRELLEDQERSHWEFEKIKSEFPSTAVRTFRTSFDNLSHGIANFVTNNRIDLMVMSSHGDGDYADFFVGSAAESLVRIIPVPVLIISKGMKYKIPARILFPNSLRLNQDKLLQGIKELQEAFNATLHILLVNTPQDFHNDADAKLLFRDFIEYYGLKNCTANVRNNQSELNGILSYYREINADIIALATHGREGISHFLKGSIAEEVLHRSECPVWIYKTL